MKTNCSTKLLVNRPYRFFFLNCIMNVKCTVKIHLRLSVKCEILRQLLRNSFLIDRVLLERNTQDWAKIAQYVYLLLWDNRHTAGGQRYRSVEGQTKWMREGRDLKFMLRVALQKDVISHWVETWIEYFPMFYFGEKLFRKLLFSSVII
jgi:hypothetical protein